MQKGFVGSKKRNAESQKRVKKFPALARGQGGERGYCGDKKGRVHEDGAEITYQLYRN